MPAGPCGGERCRGHDPGSVVTPGTKALTIFNLHFVFLKLIIFYMQKVAITICSINYLAQAKTLGDSLMKHNPDYTFLIGLVDRLDATQVEKHLLPPYNHIELHTIGIEDLDEMCARYNITELNTAVKPYFLDHVYQTYPDAQLVHYFDPDIIIYQPLTEIETGLKSHSLFLTPHTLTAYPDDECTPNERGLLNTGLYNLGFLGTKRSETTQQFLQWWKDRLFDQCFIDLANGMFVDQLWVNFAPIFHEDVYVSRHLGLNMAYWNLHERQITNDNEPYLINEISPLIFFHFSGYSPDNPKEISKYQDRYTFQEKGDIASIFDYYAQALIANGHKELKKYACYYIKPAREIPVKRYLRVRKYASMPFKWVIRLIENA